jgi:hypothetical protein
MHVPGLEPSFSTLAEMELSALAFLSCALVAAASDYGWVNPDLGRNEKSQVVNTDKGPNG